MSDVSANFSDEENYDYSKDLDDILAKYEEAARWEYIYLLCNIFPLISNVNIQVQCGLSPARSFRSAIIIKMLMVINYHFLPMNGKLSWSY
jgi:hypothetical protein